MPKEPTSSPTMSCQDLASTNSQGQTMGNQQRQDANFSTVVLSACRDLQKIIDGQKDVILDGHSLNLSDVVSVANYHTKAVIANDQKVLNTLDRSVEILSNKLADGEVIYGVTTGFGGSADTRTADYAALQKSLIQHHNAAVVLPSDRGQPTSSILGSLKSHAMPIPVVKAAMLVRCNSLVRGHSAVRVQVIRHILTLLENDMTPVVPLRGSISACGDLTPLAFIAGALEGNPDISINCGEAQGYRIIPADQALVEAGIPPLEFGPKEGLGLLNGTAFSSGAGALVLFEANQLLMLSQALTAMGTEALLGTKLNYHPFIAGVRPHPGQKESAFNIFKFLSDSKIATGDGPADHKHVRHPGPEILAQDRYALRTSTQWIGPQIENMSLSLKQVECELNSTTDNPLIDPDTAQTHHGGNFQAASVTSAMEKTMTTMQMIGRMLFSQCSEILNPTMNKGLPPNLSADEPSLSFAFKGVDINMASYMSELAYLTHPVSNYVQSAEMHNQGLNSLALITARYAGDTVEVLSLMTATYLYVLCQALDLRVLHIEFANQARELVNSKSAELFGHSVPADKIPTFQNLMWEELMEHWERASNMDLHSRCVATVCNSMGELLELSNYNGNEACWKEGVLGILENVYGETRRRFLQQQTTKQYLCTSSRLLYTFVRENLGVPMHRGLVDHPTYDSGENIKKETIGSNIGKVYAALREGAFRDVLLKCWE